MSQNLDRLKEAFKIWNDKKGGPEAIDKWMSLFAEKCRFHSLGDDQSELTFINAAQSKAEVRTFFEGLTSTLRMVHYTTWHFIEQGDRIAVLGMTGWSNPATGAVAETMIGTFWRFEDGKIVELFQLYDTAELMRLMASPAGSAAVAPPGPIAS